LAPIQEGVLGAAKSGGANTLTLEVINFQQEIMRLENIASFSPKLPAFHNFCAKPPESA
jgi:hypothetical protein